MRKEREGKREEKMKSNVNNSQYTNYVIDKEKDEIRVYKNKKLIDTWVLSVIVDYGLDRFYK